METREGTGQPGQCSPQNENLNLLVGIKFLEFMLYTDKYVKNTEKFTGLNKVLLVLGWRPRTGAHRENCQ